MGKGREVWTDEFIEEFKKLYAKYGRDSDCYAKLYRFYRSQYPLLTCNQLSRLRLKRKDAFDKAREEYLIALKQDTNKRQRDNMIKAKDLNDITVSLLMRSQEEYIENIERLDNLDPDYDKEKLSLLRLITSIQKEINSFSGLDLESALNDFTKRLISKKIVEEKDINFLRSMMSGDFEALGSGGQERTPKVKLIEDQEDEDY